MRFVRSGPSECNVQFANTHQVLELFSIHIIHTGRHTFCSIPEPEARCLRNILLEVSGYQAREVTLDPIHPNSFRDQVTPGKPVPFPSNA